jgi:hypothetical protein
MGGSERFSRQERLGEVGLEGQRKIASSTGAVGGEGADVERAYLAGAGVGCVIPRRGEPESFAHASVFEFDGPRQVGAGAWRALAQLRAALGTGVR